MDQDYFEWLLLLVRWLHITVAVTWIGTSIFFMWLDRSFQFNKESKREGHVGELWMVHGGGFYHVEKLLMGPTPVPDKLHWFKWESYWTWFSGTILLAMIFYTGEGTFLLDSTVSNITYGQGVLIGIFSMVGSWFFYDFLWERELTKKTPLIGHFLTLGWLVGMSYFLCHTLSGRAAYMHIGSMLGTWMTANVFMRIIPRQMKMVEACKKGEPVNQDWGKNAKNRSTHNTYFTLPVIFIMLSNHFPMTYGHEYNWVILLIFCLAGAAIREFFVVRISNPPRSKVFGSVGAALILALMIFTRENVSVIASPPHPDGPVAQVNQVNDVDQVSHVDPEPEKGETQNTQDINGTIFFEGVPPQGKKLNLPSSCAKVHTGDVYSNEVIVNNGRLVNVLVRVTKGLEGKSFPDIPKTPVILDQRGCLYYPRVAAGRVGQPFEFINSDPLFHNVKSVSNQNERFNFPMPKKDQREVKIFKKPEITLQVKCSVHPWMGAYLAIMDHPYFDVSDDKGEFTIKNIPPGTYTLEVWHEVFGVQEKQFSVGNQAPMVFNFTFKKE